VIDSKGNTLAVIDNINTSGEWEMQTIYVTNSITELETYLVLGMEGHNSSEYVFFDTVSYETSSSSDLENEDLSNKNVFYANLVQNDFVSHSNKTLKPYVYEDLSFYVLESLGTSSYHGVIDSRNYSNMPVYPESDSNNMLVISNAIDSYITLVSNYTYSLVADTYYEFALWIRTANISPLDDTLYGAFFEVVGLDSDGNFVDRESNTTRFRNILTTASEDNGWTRYSMYIKCESAQDVKILLGLGDETLRLQGNVYVSGITAQSISKDEYAEKENNSTTIVTSVVEKEEDKGDEPSSKETNPTDINFFALFSSLLLVIALILAIVGYLIRRIPKKNKPKKSKKKPVYSKEASIIDKTTVARDLADKRKVSISEIDKSLNELNSELNKLKTEYEEKSKDDEFVNTTLYKEYSSKANMLSAEIEKLESAKAYLINERAIKNAERKEVKRRQKEIDKEFEKLKEESDN
jgi:flagellar biogenesis protein FliO